MDRSNRFEDHRIGAQDGTEGDSEDAQLARFQRVREEQLREQTKAAGKRAEFSLQDHLHLQEEDENSDEELRVNPDFRPGFEDMVDKVDDDGRGGRSANAHDIQGTLERAKTKEEVMSELIDKSKAYRAQRHMEAAQQMELVEELDEMWGDIRSQLEYRRPGEDGDQSNLREQSPCPPFPPPLSPFPRSRCV